MTDAGGLDVLADIPAADGRRIPYEELAGRANTIQGDGFVIRAAALDDIIASKELSENCWKVQGYVPLS